MWATILTVIKQRQNLRMAGILALCVALITTLFFDVSSYAAPGINQAISFQGRLQYATGGVVADGFYNMQFKIYQDGTKTSGGTLEWTETYVNDNDSEGVEVKNGYFSVELGSNNPFGSQVDWNQDTLWLTMNVAGSADNCTTFNSGACIADGEMNPRQRFTSTPYSLNSGALQGKTADNFIQLAQGLQEDASFNTSVAINKTGTGNFVELQNAGTDVLTIEQDGDLVFGSETNHSIVVDGSAADTVGRDLYVQAGTAGSGDGANGGTLILQGGHAGGTNGHGGWVSINAGDATGTGNDGTILIGEYTTGTINIGTMSEAQTQTVNIGANNTAGSSTDVTVGSGGSAAGGTTKVQSKDNTTIATDGVDRAVFDTNGNLTLGNGVSSDTPDDFRIQGTSSSASGVSGGALTIQGGGATTGNANGGNLILSGGAGAGTGTKGLVVLDTPTYATSTVQSSAVNANVTQSNIDSFGMIMLNATTADITFTLGAPSLGASATGRMVFISAANGSQFFNLRANSGGGTYIEHNIPVRQNTTAALVWNGSHWSSIGASSSGSLQTAYNTTLQSGDGGAEMVVSSGTDADGLTIRDNDTNPVNGTLFEVQSASAANYFSVNGTATEYATNPGAEQQGASATTFPADTWYPLGTATVTRQATPGNYIASGSGAVKVTTIASYTGVHNQLNTTLAPNTTYNVSLSVRLESGMFDKLGVYYTPEGDSGNGSDCQEDNIVTTSEWRRVSCWFTTPASGISSANTILIGQTDGTPRTFYIDNLSVALASNPGPSVQVGGGQTGGPATLFTVDQSASVPTDDTSEALFGSMYYDTEIGKLQCFEADGWGACGEAPDTFVTLTPEFSGAVMNGSSLGTMSSDICSDDLNINDAANGTPVCNTDETYNFYRWNSTNTSAQTKSIYVNYLLPSTFKEFVEGSLSLLGRRDASVAHVSYQVYHSDEGNLTACGSVVNVTTTNNTWQTGVAGGHSDPFYCNGTVFEGGDSIVIRVNMRAEDNANSFVSNLRFAYSNN